jgi:hypothetical protein
VGSVLNLPALTTITNQSGNTVNLQAQNGGQVGLPVLTSIAITSTGHVFLDAEQSGSQLNVSMLASVGGSGNTLQLNNGGVILDNLITTWIKCAININGGTYTLANLTSIDSTNVHVNSGGSLALPNIASYTIAAGSGNTLQASGNGSVLNFPALTTITNQSGNTLNLQALNGAQAEFPALTSIAITSGSAFLDSEQTGSLLSVPTLASVGGSGNFLKLFGGGAVVLPSGQFSPPGNPGANPVITVPSIPGGLILQMPVGAVSNATFNIPQNTSVQLINGTVSGNALFNVASGSTLDLTGGQTVSYSGTLTANGPGTIQLTGGTLQVASGGLTFDFTGNTFQWTGGTINDNSAGSSLANLGTMNLSGGNNKQFNNGGIFDNSGTIINTGTGSLNLGGGSTTTFQVESGASYQIEANSSISANVIVNKGLIRKSASTGTTNLNASANLSNTGTIEADSGTININAKTTSQISGSVLAGGDWEARGGSTVNFPSGSNFTTNQAVVVLDGIGAKMGGLANLASNSGSLALTGGASFNTVGDFSNAGSLAISAGSSAGSALNVKGNYSQPDSGALNIQIGSSPGNGAFGQLVVTGSASLAGSFGANTVNDYGPTAGQTYQVMSFASVSGSFTSFTNQGVQFTAQLTSTTYLLTVTSTTITGSVGDNVEITPMPSGGFSFMVNGTETQYSTSGLTALIYNGPAGSFSKVVFDDPSNSYTVTQTLAGTQLVTSSGFQLELDNIANLYVYGNSTSTATVNVSLGGGSNFFVDAVDGNYSYIADPVNQTYSELSGFGSETITGSAGTTYAYIYSTSHASTVASPGKTTFTVNGVTSTLTNFPQVYVVGAADGTDSVTLNASGGTFVSSPNFSYVGGTAGGASFLLGALYAANVTAQASSGGQDKAVFYSYPADTFSGAPNKSSLAGSTTNVTGSNVNFVSQAVGFNSVSVFESGAGSDVANLTSPGHGSFFGTPTASVLAIGTSTITVDTYFTPSGGSPTAVPSAIVVTGNHDGTDQASISDEAGSNALVVGGSQAVLTTALGSVTINKFGSLTANKGNGGSDTAHMASAIDFVLSDSGWTSV